MAISLVAIATATLFLFLYVVFKGTEKRIWFIYFLVLLSTVSVQEIYY